MAYRELKALAVLAAWRPAPRVITPPETLRKWGAFWLQRRQSADPLEKGIAAIALLNLSEDTLRSVSIPLVSTEQLLHEVTVAIQDAVKREASEECLTLLDWQPVKETTWPVAEVKNVAQSWLKAARHKEVHVRLAAWQQLIRWDRAGSLDICGIDLLPELVNAVPTENNASVLWEMAKWLPGAKNSAATERPDSSDRRPKLEAAWERHRTSGPSLGKAAGWLAGIRLHQAGLASEPPESFLNAYISTVADTSDSFVLFILAQWFPDGQTPGRWYRDWHNAWEQRLLYGEAHIRPIAAWALLRQFLEEEHGLSLRRAALEQWRAKTKGSSGVRQIMDIAFSRFQDVRACLAAGEVPDFGDKPVPFAEPVPPAERHRPLLALPPGRIADNEWKMENEKLKMENEEWKMKHQEVTTKANHPLVPDSPSR